MSFNFTLRKKASRGFWALRFLQYDNGAFDFGLYTPIFAVGWNAKCIVFDRHGQPLCGSGYSFWCNWSALPCVEGGLAYAGSFVAPFFVDYGRYW